MNAARAGRSPIYLIRRCHQIQDAFFSEETAGYGLTSLQFLVLKAIDRFPGIEQTALAEYIAYDVSTVGGVLERLAAKGYLQRATSARDRRRRPLTLTASGKSTLRTVMKPGKHVEKRLMAALTPTERKQLLTLLDRIVSTNDALRQQQSGLADTA